VIGIDRLREPQALPLLLTNKSPLALCGSSYKFSINRLIAD